MTQPISSIMQEVVTSVGMDATVAEVETLLKSHHISSVPVFESDEVILGLITTSDLMKFQATGRNPGSAKAWEICSYRPFEANPDTPIIDVADLMLTHKIHHVVVVENGSIKGIVSSLDFVKLFAEQNRP